MAESDSCIVQLRCFEVNLVQHACRGPGGVDVCYCTRAVSITRETVIQL